MIPCGLVPQAVSRAQVTEGASGAAAKRHGPRHWRVITQGAFRSVGAAPSAGSWQECSGRMAPDGPTAHGFGGCPKCPTFQSGPAYA